MRLESRQFFRARRRSAACATTSRRRTRKISNPRILHSICCHRSIFGFETRKSGTPRCAGARNGRLRNFSMATIRQCAAKYLAELGRRGASAHTLRNYGSDLEQFAAYFEPPGETGPPMEQLDLALLREWMSGLYDQGLSVVSVRRKLAALRAMCKFLLAEGIVPVNPAARLRTPKAKQRLPEVMSAEKTNNMLDAVERGEGLERPSRERDIAFLELLYG